MSVAGLILIEPRKGRLITQHGDDRFRQCNCDWKKRVENVASTRKCPLQTIGAKSNSTDFALAA